MTQSLKNAIGRDVPEGYRPFKAPDIDYVPKFIPEVYRGYKTESKVMPSIRAAKEKK